MILTETIQVDGKPVGKIIVDSNVREIAFTPHEGQSRLPEQRWENVEQLKQAVIKAYSKIKKTQATKPGFSIPLARTSTTPITKGEIDE